MEKDQINSVVLLDGVKLESDRRGFDIIFDIIPPISFYQSIIVFFGLWLCIPAGAIQLAAIILQAKPEGKKNRK